MTVTVLQVDSLPDIAEGLQGQRLAQQMNNATPDEADDDRAKDVHPLARFVDLQSEPRPPNWLLPGIIASGVVVMAGCHGVGKTTAAVPLALTVAGLHARADDLAPKHWRHVIYVAEDAEQVHRVLAGVAKSDEIGTTIAQIGERFHLVPAQRLKPERVAEVGAYYREHFTRTVAGIELLPLVVLDTKSAVLALDDENSNAEASQAIAALKQGFANLPIWIIGHVSKSNGTRSEVAALSTRGASALDADATQTLFIVKEADGARYLIAGKTRFDPKWPELVIEPRWVQVMAIDQFGEPEELTLRWSRARPPQSSRAEARDAANEAQRKAEDAELRADVLTVVDTAWQVGLPLNRAGVAAKMKRRRDEVLRCIDALVAERWLIEVHVPSKLRQHPRRSEFLARLNPAEHDQVTLAGAPLPAEKMVIPASWRKADSSVPDSSGGAGTDGASQGEAGRA